MVRNRSKRAAHETTASEKGPSMDRAIQIMRREYHRECTDATEQPGNQQCNTNRDKPMMLGAAVAGKGEEVQIHLASLPVFLSPLVCAVICQQEERVNE